MTKKTAATTTLRLKLVRTGQTCESVDAKGKKATGRRGKLTVGGKPFYTIERANGYVSLPNGTYNCKTGRRGSNQKPCIQISHNVRNSRGKRAGIVIHEAKKPHHLQGCIAPGKTKGASGIGQSDKALKEIFEALGASDTQFGHEKTVKVACKLIVSGK
ncbi:MAG: DUF5675 family protein [Myxococcota bacterium]